MHYLTLFLIAALLTLTPACEKEPLDTLDELVPATQEGANTLGCLIDGEVFYNRGGSLSTQDIIGRIATIPYERIKVIGKDLTGSLDIVVSIKIPSPFEGEHIVSEAYIAYSEGLGSSKVDFVVDTNAKYSVIVSNYDAQNNIISGFFNFSVINPFTQDRKVITDGRFDVRYF